MANLQTIILDTGKAELLEPDIIAFPKYFKISSEEIPVLATIDASTEGSYNFWYQKDIDIFKVIDSDTVEFTCVLEASENTNNTRSICLYFDNPNSTYDIPFLLGVLNEDLPSNTRVVITLQFKLTNATEKIDFSFITTDELEEGLLSLNTLMTLGNQISKNTTIINKIYLPDVLDTPEITSETFSLT
jgi:hypothetical protein